MVVYENKSNRKYKKIGREKQIQWTYNGVPFFRYHNRRIKLDDVLRLIHPIMYYNKYAGDINGIISGYYTEGLNGFLVEITEGGESVILWEELPV